MARGLAATARYLQTEADRLFIEAAADLLPPAPLRGALACYEEWEPLFQKRPWLASALGLIDRYYLMLAVLGRGDLLNYEPSPPSVPVTSPDWRDDGNAWLYARCREVEADPDDHLDLWGRTHFKSSIITNGGGIQEALRDPEITTGIFSHTRDISKKFLGQIKQEFEINAKLKRLYPDVCWQDPQNEAPVWSSDHGLILKRRGNPKESTFEAWGLVDGQPTSRHFKLRIYNDVVTDKSVTPDMVKKTTSALELSDNLGTEGGRRWFEGTRYNFADSYQILIDRGAVNVRLYPATHDGTLTGRPVLLKNRDWQEKRVNQPTTIAAQMLQNPAAGIGRTFELGWQEYYFVRPRTLNIYIIGDPSAGRQRKSDNTAFAVIGIDAQEGKWLLDGFRHRMSLAERWQHLSGLYRKWSGLQTQRGGVQSVQVFYEEYGLQTDIEHFEEKMREPGQPVFAIEPVNWVKDSPQAKVKRVERLVPDIQQGRLRIPAVVWHEVHGEAIWKADGQQLLYDKIMPGKEPEEWRAARERGDEDLIQGPIKRVIGADFGRIANRQPGSAVARRSGYDTMQVYDLTRGWLEEMQYFPFGGKDDLLDAGARIYDTKPVAPRFIPPGALDAGVYVDT